MRALNTIFILTLTATTVLAKPPLRDVAEIDVPLFEVALADEIRKKCPTIDGRMAKGIKTLWTLKRRANELGYSDAEIDAYRKSESEKARMRRKGDKWLAARGVNQSKTDDWCRVGRDEIKKGSRIGGLLREN